MQSLVAREVQFDPMSPGSHSLQVVLQIVHLTFNSWTACLCAASYHIWLSQFSILVSFFWLCERACSSVIYFQKASQSGVHVRIGFTNESDR